MIEILNNLKKQPNINSETIKKLESKILFIENMPDKGSSEDSDLWEEAKQSLHGGIDYLYEGKILAKYPSEEYCKHAKNYYGVTIGKKAHLTQCHKFISIESINYEKGTLDLSMNRLIKVFYRRDNNLKTCEIPIYTVITEDQTQELVEENEQEIDWDTIEEEF